MSPVRRAIWYVESHFQSDVTLDDIALGSGVSACHLTRAFAAVTGRSAMRYLRGRRLSEAARTLARGAPDIIAVALDAGYSSHEAFTRAFREQFGVTPEWIRARRRLDDIELVEPIRMADAPIADLGPPRIEATTKPLLVAGLGQRHADASNAIPAQWQRFHPYIGNLHGQVGELAYGIIRKGDAAASVDYICGIEVSDFSEIPEEFVRLRIPPQRYAVFFHRDHISTVRSAFAAIWDRWLPELGGPAPGGLCFERYGDTFDSCTGTGGVEIWIPLGGKGSSQRIGANPCVG